MTRRVVITGMGVVCSAGNDFDSYASRVLAGERRFSPLADPRVAHLTGKYAGLVADTALREALQREGEDGSPVWEGRAVDRVIALALAAAREALRRSGISPRDLDGRMGLVFATCSGPMHSIERHYERIVQGDPRIDAADLFAKRYYAPATVLAGRLGIRGCSTTVATACSASTGALGIAADLIRAGMLDAALVGGADAFALSTLAGFDGLKATAQDPCAPFSLPVGLTLGEGAGFLVLEEAAVAAGRGATVAAELLGYGLSNDAHHPTAPDPAGKGQSRAMAEALADAGLTPAAITYVNAHGTGTEANDRAEVKAIRRTFGPGAEGLPVSSTKSMVGHCLGAAGAVEAIAAIAGAREGVFPPTAGFTQPRDGCTIDCVPAAGRQWTAPGPFMSNNFAFGGNNASVVLAVGRRPEDRGAAAPGRPVTDEAIFISGLGVVSPAGVGVAALAQAVSAGTPVIARVSLDGAGSVAAARVPAFDMRTIDRRLDIRGMDRSSVLALAAVRLALSDARLGDRPSDCARLGLYTHLSAGPSWGESQYLTALYRQQFHLDKVLAFPYIVPNSVAGNVCRALMLTGHNTTLCGGPQAGLFGLEPAMAALRAGHAGALLSASVDELSERILLDGFHAQTGDAGAPDEGAVALVLETETHLRARGGRPLACVRSLATGFCGDRASACDALTRAVRRALDDAGVAMDQMGTIICGAADRCACESLDALDAGWLGRRLDVAPIIGRAEAGESAMGLAAALEIRRGHRVGRQPFLLAVARGAGGMHGAAVFEAIDSAA